MRILMLTPEPPARPLGGAFRNHYLLSYLGHRHEVHLVSFYDEPLGGDESRFLDMHCASVSLVPGNRASGVPRRLAQYAAGELAGGGLPWMVRERISGAFRGAVAGKVRALRPDAVLAEHLSTVPYLELARDSRLIDPTAAGVVYDAHNVESVILAQASAVASSSLRRRFAGREARRVRRYEQRTLSHVAATVALSDLDRDALRELDPAARIERIPIGVDVEYLAPPPGQTRGAVPPTLLFLGSLHWHPNVEGLLWFVREVFPAIRATLADVRLHIVGRSPAAAVTALRAVPGVVLDADVPDIRPHLWAADAMVVPLSMGSGQRVKILEAMAAGCPIVSTHVGAAGIEVEACRHVLFADAAQAFADACLRLLGDAESARQMSDRASALVAAEYRYEVMGQRMEALLAAVAADCRATAARKRLAAGESAPAEVPARAHRAGPSLVPGLRHAPPARPRREAISVLMTVRNEADTLPMLLERILGQVPAPLEVLVVDGGSTDGSLEIALAHQRRDARLRVWSLPGCNIPEGRNFALARVRGDIIVAADAGSWPLDDWLAELIRPLQADPGVSVVGGFYLPAPGGLFESALAAANLPLRDEVRADRFLPSSRSMAIRRHVLDVVPGYPENLPIGEDMFFNLQAQAAGLQVAFARGSTVVWQQARTTAEAWRKFFAFGRGDGRARMHGRRHAARFAAYGTLPALLLLGASAPGWAAWAWGALLALGAAIYLRRPWLRALTSAPPPGIGRRAVAALAPALVLLLDIAKMSGYVAGRVDRLRFGARESRRWWLFGPPPLDHWPAALRPPRQGFPTAGRWTSALTTHAQAPRGATTPPGLGGEHLAELTRKTSAGEP
ncbi:MAG: glycosyltransferase [Candidatus Schekmanbacteria bacterium]|nr:glycosyltransferase [Candidatus Schekmanbacteria bacterium]